jgi:predicted nucleotidyltransferase
VKLGKDSREFVGLLLSERVEFLVVGGHAVAFHGFPRFTGDIDFLFRPTVDNAERVLAVLRRFGFDVELDAAALTLPGQVIQLGRPPNRIDLLTSISGVDFDTAWRDRVAGKLDGLEVSYIGLEALLANKAATGRTKDRLDLEELARRRPG